MCNDRKMTWDEIAEENGKLRKQLTTLTTQLEVVHGENERLRKELIKITAYAELLEMMYIPNKDSDPKHPTNVKDAEAALQQKG